MIRIDRVDFLDPTDAHQFVDMLNQYACDPMGDGRPLAPEVRQRLAEQMGRLPNALAWLARDASGEPLGVLTAFVGFSTFAGRLLINIHDVSVVAAARGQGISSQLFAAVESHARAIGCVRLTLEVRGDNLPAQRAYQRLGFVGATSCAPADGYLFWKKELETAPS
jgi:GNAT superfamily N-acetyltransferase